MYLWATFTQFPSHPLTSLATTNLLFFSMILGFLNSTYEIQYLSFSLWLIFKNNFIILAVLDLHFYVDFLLVGASGSYSLWWWAGFSLQRLLWQEWPEKKCTSLSERRCAHICSAWDIFLCSFFLRICSWDGSFVSPYAHPMLPLLHMISMADIDNSSEIDYCVPILSQNPCPQSTHGSN